MTLSKFKTKNFEMTFKAWKFVLVSKFLGSKYRKKYLESYREQRRVQEEPLLASKVLHDPDTAEGFGLCLESQGLSLVKQLTTRRPVGLSLVTLKKISILPCYIALWCLKTKFSKTWFFQFTEFTISTARVAHNKWTKAELTVFWARLH